MKRTFRKLICAALAIVMILSMVVMTSAANTTAVEKELEEAADNYALDIRGTFKWYDCKVSGQSFTTSLQLPNALADHTVTVLILATDENGKALNGHSIHYINGTLNGTTVTVTYQEHGCRYFAMLPAQWCEEWSQNRVYMDLSETRIGDTYRVHCRATTLMSDDLAKIAYITKDFDVKMKRMRFTAYLNGPLVECLTEENLNDFIFTDPTESFEFLDAWLTDEGVAIQFKLIPEKVDSWKYYTEEQFITELRKTMTLEVYHDFPATLVESLMNSENRVYCSGYLELTNTEGEVPYVQQGGIVFPCNIDYITKHNAVADPSETGVDRYLNLDVDGYIAGYPDKLFHPNDNITRAQAATIFYRLLKDESLRVMPTFDDVPQDSWYASAVGTLAYLGIVEGVGDNKFEPNRAITRAEFAAMCTRFAYEADATITFADVPTTHWAYKNIMTAATYGWVNGYSDGTFRPNKLIVRTEAVTLVNHMLAQLGGYEDITAEEYIYFPDVPETHWAFNEVCIAAYPDISMMKK